MLCLLRYQCFPFFYRFNHKCRVCSDRNQHVQRRDVGDNHLEFHPGSFLGNKIEGVPWYISYYSPPAHFFSLSCASVYFYTTSRILKLKAFRGTSHIIPPCTSRILTLKAFRGTAHIIPPSANFFSLSWAPIYFSTPSRI